jgi:hypothetical protein
LVIYQSSLADIRTCVIGHGEDLLSRGAQEKRGELLCGEKPAKK